MVAEPITRSTATELAPYYTDERVRLFNGDMLAVLPTLAENSLDACVTDPPYELGFMGKAWDSTGIAFRPETWAAVYRVLKPGAHLIAFTGTRTYHRIACAIEDAGFEVRDQILWLYGSGFPKSMDIAKAIDKRKFDRDDVLKVTAWIAGARDAAGLTNGEIDEAMGFAGMAGHWTSLLSRPAIPTPDNWTRLLEVLGNPEVPAEIASLMVYLNERKGMYGDAWYAREVTGQHEPASPEAAAWLGWGTTLKPACEPAVLARKPMIGTTVQNVLAHGTGGLNIDACRIGVEAMPVTRSNGVKISENGSMAGANYAREDAGTKVGRWPANVILGCACPDSGHFDDCAVALVDAQVPSAGGGFGTRGSANGVVGFNLSRKFTGPTVGYGDEGGASRFFYTAKASRSEREAGLEGFARREGGKYAQGDWSRENMTYGKGPRANHHPTVKPVSLMEHLCRLVTPPGGVVLDPFMGSGSTRIAAQQTGFRFVGVEMDPEFCRIAGARLAQLGFGI